MNRFASNAAFVSGVQWLSTVTILAAALLSMNIFPLLGCFLPISEPHIG